MPIISDAIVSDDGVYRYWLMRRWGIHNHKGIIFIGFNPSQAKIDVRDPTDRKCQGFASREYCGWYGLINPFAFRATDPDQTKQAFIGFGEEFAVGPDNNEHIIDTLRSAREDGNAVVAAWGTLGGQQWAKSRIADVVQQCRHEKVDLRCLGLTKEGHPRHPLMVSYKQPIERLPDDWAPPA